MLPLSNLTQLSTAVYCTVVEGCQAGRLGHLLQDEREYNAESLKQGSKRFNPVNPNKSGIGGKPPTFVQNSDHCLKRTNCSSLHA